MARTANKAMMLAVAGTVGGLLSGPCGAGAALAAEDGGGLTFRQAQGAKPASIFQFSNPTIIVPTSVRPVRDAEPGSVGAQRPSEDMKPANAGDAVPAARNGGRGSVRVIPRAEMDPDEPRATPKPRRKPVMSVEVLPPPEIAPANPSATPHSDDATSQVAASGGGEPETPAEVPRSDGVIDAREGKATDAAVISATRREQSQLDGSHASLLDDTSQPPQPASVATTDASAMPIDAKVNTDPAMIQETGGSEGRAASKETRTTPAEEPPQVNSERDTSIFAKEALIFATGVAACLIVLASVLRYRDWHRRRMDANRRRTVVKRASPMGDEDGVRLAWIGRGRAQAVRAAGMVERDRQASDMPTRMRAKDGQAHHGDSSPRVPAHRGLTGQEKGDATHRSGDATLVSNDGPVIEPAPLAQPWTNAVHRAAIVGIARRAA